MLMKNRKELRVLIRFTFHQHRQIYGRPAGGRFGRVAAELGGFQFVARGLFGDFASRPPSGNVAWVIGRFIYQFRWLVLLVWLAVAAVLALLAPIPDATVGE